MSKLDWNKVAKSQMNQRVRNQDFAKKKFKKITPTPKQVSYLKKLDPSLTTEYLWQLSIGEASSLIDTLKDHAKKLETKSNYEFQQVMIRDNS